MSSIGAVGEGSSYRLNDGSRVGRDSWGGVGVSQGCAVGRVGQRSGVSSVGAVGHGSGDRLDDGSRVGADGHGSGHRLDDVGVAGGDGGGGVGHWS